MAFDARDPYDAAALYDMWLNCQGCTRTFDFEPDKPIGLDYYHDIGQRAKQERWVIREQPGEEDEVDGIAWQVLCPACAARHGIRPDHRLRARAHPAIEEIRQSLQRARELVAA